MEFLALLLPLAILVFLIASIWTLYAKAGEPGWAAIVPIYNIIVYLKICGKPAWWIILMLIPIANFIVAIMLSIELAKAFGKDTGFAIGLILLPIVFLPMLAFGNAKYTAPVPAA